MSTDRAATLTDVATTLQDMYPYARSLAKSSDRADDLIQDTFIQASRYLHTFNHGSLGAWLNTMMRNLFLSELRSARVRLNVSLEKLPPNFEVPVPPTAEWEWDAARTIEMIDKLTPDHREVLALVADGTSYKDVAEQLGIELGTMKSRVTRARENLKALLNS